MHITRRLLAFLVAAGLCVGLALPASAASGLQYDEITKMYMDGSTPDVGSFTPDYTKLASRPPAPQGGGGPPGMGSIGKILMGGANPMSMMSMFTDGFLTRHASLGAWTRTDDPNTQTARITKCDSGQVITLNLANKTYRIIDPTAPAPSTAGRGAGPSASRTEMDPGKTKITMKTSALGAKTIDGTATDGYQMSTLITTEREGKTSNFQIDGTAYFTAMTEHRTPCAGAGAGMNMAGPMAMMAQSASMMRQMMNNDRFKIEVSGPTPPYAHLPLYMVQKMSGGEMSGPGGRGGVPTFLIERGNLKTLGDADKSLFEIPAGFTKEN